MKRLTQIFKKNLRVELFLIILLGIVPSITWFKSGHIIFGHDMGFPLTPIDHFFDRLFIWTERLGLGFDQSMGIGTVFSIQGFEALIKAFGFSLQATQKVMVCFWLIALGLSMYYFISSLNLKKKSFFLPLIAGVFYMFNHFFLQAWPAPERTKFSIAVALPLVLSFAIRGLERKMSLLKSGLLIALVLFFFNGGGGSSLPLYGGLIISLGVCLVYFTFLEWQKTGIKALKRVFLLTILILFLFVILNFYWILPSVRFVLVNYSSSLASSGGAAGVLGWVKEISKHASLLNLFRLQGIPDWYGNPKHSYANFFLENPILILLSFLWPLFAFVSILLAESQKEKRYVLFFNLLALLSMIFTAGSHPPTGKIYEIFIKYIPFFPIFRTPFYKFGYGIWFAYAFLISFTVNKLVKQLKNKWLSSFTYFIFIIFILLYNFPFFTGSFFNWNPPLSIMVKVPNYIFEFGKWADSLEKDERVLMLPPLNENWKADVYNWKYWSLSSVPSLLTRKSVLVNSNGLGKNETALIYTFYDALWNRDEVTVKRLASFLSIKYFLLRKDVFYELEWCPTISPEKVEERLEDFDWIKLEYKFGEWVVYRLELGEFLPHFYTPKKSAYVQASVDNFADVASFGDWEARPEIYLTENADMDADNTENVDRIFVVGQCVRCDLSEEMEIELPFVRFLPGSTFYPLISWKEKRWEKKIKNLNDPIQVIDLDLGLASKRLAEITRLVDEEKGENLIEETVGRYKTRIDDLSYQLKESEREGRDTNEVLLRVGDYFKKHKEVLRELLGRGLGDEIKNRLENTLWELDDLLVEIKSKQWVSGEGIRKYTLDIPKETEYELLIKSEKVGDYFIQNPLSPVVFELNGKLATKSGELRSDDWILVDKVNLEKGKHKLAIILPETRNLVEKEALFLEQENEGTKTVSLPINNFDSARLYKISFDYQTLRGIPAKFMVLQDTDKKDEELGRTRHKIEEDLRGSVFPQTFEVFFKPDLGAKRAELEFIIEASEEGKSVFEIKEMRVERVWSPKVVLRTATEKTLPTRKTPKITFRKINPTKYEVGVEGAREPYTLVFSESFHQGWKAYIQTSNIKHQAYGDEVASYFDGEIKEGTHKDIFLDRNTFKTWGKKPVSEDRHYLVNGYANSWYITPEDAEGAENYEIIIEFWPQRLFYIGIAVSVLSLLGCLGYLSWSLIKEKKA